MRKMGLIPDIILYKKRLFSQIPEQMVCRILPDAKIPERAMEGETICLGNLIRHEVFERIPPA